MRMAHDMHSESHRSLTSRCGARMTLDWIAVGLIVWALGLVVVLALFRMSGNQDRAARHSEKRLDPGSDVTITHLGNN